MPQISQPLFLCSKRYRPGRSVFRSESLTSLVDRRKYRGCNVARPFIGFFPKNNFYSSLNKFRYKALKPFPICDFFKRFRKIPRYNMTQYVKYDWYVMYVQGIRRSNIWWTTTSSTSMFSAGEKWMGYCDSEFLTNLYKIDLIILHLKYLRVHYPKTGVIAMR
jgi:hypothetical protein